MAFDAGAVFATLGGRFSPTAFAAFDRSMLNAARNMEAGEKRMRSSAERTSASMAAMGRATRFAAVGAAAGFGLFVASSVRKAAEFEQTLNVLKETSGATDRQMKAVSKTALKLGADTKLPATSAKDAADAMLQLSKGGLSVRQTMGAARGVLQLSAAAQISNADAAEVAADALNAFGLKGREAVRVADLLAAAANATTTDIPPLASALQQSAASAHALGIPIEDLVTMLGQLANAGIKSSDSGTSVKTMLQALTPNSRRAAEMMDKLNVSAFDQAGRFVGMPKLIGQFTQGLRGLSQEQRAVAIETIFGSDASRAANIILGQSVEKHRQLKQRVTESGAAADLAAAQTKGAKGATEAFNSAVDTLQVSLGLALLPTLTQLARDAATFVSELDPAGVQRFGEGIASGLRTAIDVGGDFVAFGADVAEVLHDIGAALDLGDTDKLTAIVAGIAAFKIAGVVAPMVVTLASAIRMLVLNARTASSVSMFLSGFNANPIMAVATAVGLAASAFVLFRNSQISAAEAARDTTAALKEQTAAANALQDAILAAADATFAARQSDRELARARRETADAAKEYGRGSAEYRKALENENEIALRNTATHRRLRDEKSKMRAENARTVTEGQAAIAKAKAELAAKLKELALDGLSGEDFAAQAGAAFDRYGKTLERVGRNTAVAKIAQLELQRVLNGGGLIATKNADSVAKLADVFKLLPKQQQIRLATTAQPALVQIGELIGRLKDVPKQQVVQILTRAETAKAQIAALTAVANGVPARRAIAILSTASSERVKILALQAALNGVKPRVVSRILADGALSEKAKVDALRASIDGLRDKNVNVTTTFTQRYNAGQVAGPLKPRAAGKAAGSGERALVGEGRDPREYIIDRNTGDGYVTTGPMVVDLKPEHYVIPRDRQDGRALGLFRMLARDLGVPGYRRGRAPRNERRRRQPRNVPAKIAAGGVPFEDVQSRHEQADDALERSQDRKRQLGRDLADAKDDPKRAAEVRKQLEANAREIAKRKTAAERRRREYLAAKRTNDRVKNLETAINLARDAMDDADRVDDQRGFDRARDRRAAKLRDLVGVLQRAYGLAAPNTDYFRGLQEKLSQLGGDAAVQGQTSGFGGELGQVEAAQLEVEPEAMTAAERARLQDLDAASSLAALTTSLDDDRQAARERVGFLEGILAAVQTDPARGGSASIREIADLVKTARDNLDSLTGGSQTNDNADLQARFEQERTGRINAERDRDINAGALRVFGGSGDIGAGGVNAAAAASGPQIVINTLHPGDPATLNAIGLAATAGIGLQGLRQSSHDRIVI
jgi:TP901 family phage tail tape measure protein